MQRGAAAAPATGIRTRLQQGIRQPKNFNDGIVRYSTKDGTVQYGFLRLQVNLLLSEALDHPKWHQAMEEEYDALLKNQTWHLVPPAPTIT